VRGMDAKMAVVHLLDMSLRARGIRDDVTVIVVRPPTPTTRPLLDTWAQPPPTRASGEALAGWMSTPSGGRGEESGRREGG
jgi:hypothetical protein